MRHITKKEFSKKLNKIKSKNEQIELRNQLKAEKYKYRTKFKAIKTSNVVLISAIIAVVSYTIACLYIQYNIGVEVSSTLTTLWFSFWTVELVSLAGIKVSKIFKKYKSTLNQEQEYFDSCCDENIELNNNNGDDSVG